MLNECYNAIYILWQKSVSQWLKSLNLKEYEELFESEGYFSGEDVENLKGLTREDLTDMGITKRGEQLYSVHNLVKDNSKILKWLMTQTSRYISHGRFIYSYHLPKEAIGMIGSYM